MKIGVYDPVFAQMPLEEMLDFLAETSCTAVEVNTGKYPNAPHIDVDGLLTDASKLRNFQATFASRGMEISALSCHGNPLHPQRDVAQAADSIYRKTVQLAQMLDVRTIVTFSGCPGDSEGSKYPNWVTCPWPTDFLEILAWQWNTVAIPYWQEAGAFAESHGVRVALEMHPGFLVYNPETALRLRDAVGASIGVNLDPSHLFWQQIDPIHAIRILKDAVYYVHAKDTALHPYNVAANGVLDTKPYRNIAERSWVFRSVGYGHDLLFWRQFVSALREIGFDGVLSIEHEDGLASPKEGFLKAVGTLRDAIFSDDPAEPWWA